MGAHLDNSEFYMAAPIISLNFGCSAVFLIGGESRDIEPTAFYIRSGDVLVMDGKSRSAYHAVPRILADTSPFVVRRGDGGEEEEEKEEELQWMRFADYMSKGRININVRQVICPDQAQSSNGDS